MSQTSSFQLSAFKFQLLALTAALVLTGCNNKYEDSPTLDGFQPLPASVEATPAPAASH